MHEQDLFHRLEFEQHFVPDDDVGPVAASELFAVVVQWQIDLARIGQPIPLELPAEARS